MAGCGMVHQRHLIFLQSDMMSREENSVVLLALKYCDIASIHM